MVSVMDRLNSDAWEEKGGYTDDPPSGYQRYSINRRKLSDVSGVGFQYCAQDEEGKPFLLSLPGVKGNKDPLEKIANVMLKVGSTNNITGIALDDAIFESK